MLDTGFGLNSEDKKNGIEEIEGKLNSMCPHYQAMNNLMWKKSFVNLFYKVNSQKDVETTNSSHYKDEDSENSDSSKNSDNGREKNSEDLSIHARKIRERESCQSVR